MKRKMTTLLLVIGWILYRKRGKGYIDTRSLFIGWRREGGDTRNDDDSVIRTSLRFLSTVCLFLSLAQAVSWFALIQSAPLDYLTGQMITDPGDRIFCWVVKHILIYTEFVCCNWGRISFTRVRLQA